MNFALVALLCGLIIFIPGTFQTDPSSDLSEYFKVKHVVDDGNVRQTLLNPNIPDTQKVNALEGFVNTKFNAQPNPNKPAETKAWKAAFAANSGTTLILASPEEIADKLRAGTTHSQTDKKGQPIKVIDGTLPVAKIKGDFVPIQGPIKPGSPVLGNYFQLKPVQNRPLVTPEQFGAAYDKNGKAIHFESPTNLAGSSSTGSSSNAVTNSGGVPLITNSNTATSNGANGGASFTAFGTLNTATNDRRNSFSGIPNIGTNSRKQSLSGMPNIPNNFRRHSLSGTRNVPNNTRRQSLSGLPNLATNTRRHSGSGMPNVPNNTRRQSLSGPSNVATNTRRGSFSQSGGTGSGSSTPIRSHGGG